MDSDKTSYTDLPKAAIEYIDAVIKKMRYRRKIRADVRAELTAHFEDALKNCEDELRQERCKELIKEFGDVKLLGVLLRRSKKRCRAGWRTAIVRVFQGIGRVIRSEQDRGIALLIDERYAQPRYYSHLIQQWKPMMLKNQQEMDQRLRHFWETTHDSSPE